MAMPEGLAHYAEQIRAYRAELRESVAAVQKALDGTVVGPDIWRQRVHAALVELTHDFTDHVQLTESPDGLFEGIRRMEPRLSGRIDRLVGEHPDLHADIGDFIQLLEGVDDVARVPAFREELTDLLDRLVEHRRRGGDLIYEAFAVDVGGQG